MKEQDIRRILNEVCETLDRHRAKAGPLAIGAAMAMALVTACSAKYMGSMPEDTGGQVLEDAAVRYAADFAIVDSSVSEAADTADGDATDGEADAAIDAGPQMDYAVIFDSLTSQNEGG
jgi:hypothetical protein